VKTAGNTCTVTADNSESVLPFVDITLGPGGPDPAWVEMSAIIAPGAGSFDLALDTVCNTMDPVWIDDITLTPITLS
jgi:hypothetical protein